MERRGRHTTKNWLWERGNKFRDSYASGRDIQFRGGERVGIPHVDLTWTSSIVRDHIQSFLAQIGCPIHLIPQFGSRIGASVYVYEELQFNLNDFKAFLGRQTISP